jgi:hypothetical protein
MESRIGFKCESPRIEGGKIRRRNALLLLPLSIKLGIGAGGVGYLASSAGGWV